MPDNRRVPASASYLSGRCRTSHGVVSIHIHEEEPGHFRLYLYGPDLIMPGGFADPVVWRSPGMPYQDIEDAKREGLAFVESRVARIDGAVVWIPEVSEPDT